MLFGTVFPILSVLPMERSFRVQCIGTTMFLTYFWCMVLLIWSLLWAFFSVLCNSCSFQVFQILLYQNCGWPWSFAACFSFLLVSSIVLPVFYVHGSCWSWISYLATFLPSYYFLSLSWRLIECQWFGLVFRCCSDEIGIADQVSVFLIICFGWDYCRICCICFIIVGSEATQRRESWFEAEIC